MSPAAGDFAATSPNAVLNAEVRFSLLRCWLPVAVLATQASWQRRASEFST